MTGLPEMVAKTAYETATGRLRHVVRGPQGTVSFPPTDTIDWVDEAWSRKTHYAPNGIPTERPSTDLPLTHSLSKDTDWVITNVPAETIVAVNGEDIGTVDETGLTLSFDMPGIWQVDLRPPFPWLEATCEVTVS